MKTKDQRYNEFVEFARKEAKKADLEISQLKDELSSFQKEIDELKKENDYLKEKKRPLFCYNDLELAKQQERERILKIIDDSQKEFGVSSRLNELKSQIKGEK